MPWSQTMNLPLFKIFFGSMARFTARIMFTSVGVVPHTSKWAWLPWDNTPLQLKIPAAASRATRKRSWHTAWLKADRPRAASAPAPGCLWLRVPRRQEAGCSPARCVAAPARPGQHSVWPDAYRAPWRFCAATVHFVQSGKSIAKTALPPRRSSVRVTAEPSSRA